MPLPGMPEWGWWRDGGGGWLAWGYLPASPSLQGETTVVKKSTIPRMGKTPTMPFEFGTKEYIDRGIRHVADAAPTDSPAEGTVRTYSSGGTYKIYAYLNGGWRSGTLT